MTETPETLQQTTLNRDGAETPVREGGGGDPRALALAIAELADDLRAKDITLLNDADGPRPAPAFVEWLMGLPTGWVTDSDELTQNQQITALGNGVQPLQAALALSALLD